MGDGTTTVMAALTLTHCVVGSLVFAVIAIMIVADALERVSTIARQKVQATEITVMRCLSARSSAMTNTIRHAEYARVSQRR